MFFVCCLGKQMTGVSLSQWCTVMRISVSQWDFWILGRLSILCFFLFCCLVFSFLNEFFTDGEGGREVRCSFLCNKMCKAGSHFKIENYYVVLLLNALNSWIFNVLLKTLSYTRNKWLLSSLYKLHIYAVWMSITDLRRENFRNCIWGRWLPHQCPCVAVWYWIRPGMTSWGSGSGI